MTDRVPTSSVHSTSTSEPSSRSPGRTIGMLAVPPLTLVLLAFTLRAGRAADLVIAGLAMLALALAAAIFAAEE
ncbi:MAG: hypothetical protein HXY39_17340 [Chloroflexi bacterium]|nr:hypothetical protein [Chloroflexota bacterium]